MVNGNEIVELGLAMFIFGISLVFLLDFAINDLPVPDQNDLEGLSENLDQIKDYGFYRTICALVRDIGLFTTFVGFYMISGKLREPETSPDEM